MGIRVILDSSLFRGNSNLNTQRFAGLRSLVKDSHGLLVMPEAVRVEIIEGHRERLEELRQRHQVTLRQARDLPVAGMTDPIDVAAGVAEYEKRVDQFITENEIVRLDYPKSLPSPKELFALAAQKKPPFDEKGQSFRDAMISYSVRELADSTEDHILLVTEDGGFKARSEMFFEGTKVQALTLEEAKAGLKDFLSEVGKLMREDLLKKLAVAAGAKGLPVFQDYAKKNTPFNYRVPTGDSLLSIDDFKADGFAGVDDLSFENGDVAYVVKVDGTLTVSVRTTPAKKDYFLEAMQRQLNRPKKVGDAAQPEQPFSLGGLSEPVVEQRHVPVQVVFRCRSKFDANGVPTPPDILEAGKTSDRTLSLIEALMAKSHTIPAN